MGEKGKTAKETAARALMRARDSGLLSTISRELSGYPFGSVTPYILARAGRCVIYVSSIAQHTHNMLADPRVSLTVPEQGDGDQQALGRVTVVGDAALVPEDALPAVRERYFTFFPTALGHEDTHDFSFYWITPKRVRYIGGFGAIFWIEPDKWAMPTPEWAGNESQIIAHMNDDHADALVAMARHYCAVATDKAELVAVDGEGSTSGWKRRRARGSSTSSFPNSARRWTRCVPRWSIWHVRRLGGNPRRLARCTRRKPLEC